MSDIQEDRKFYLNLIDSCFERSRVDIYELGADDLGSEYRNFRPRGCECDGILSPDDEMEYYISHINMCCNSWDEVRDFYKQFRPFIEKHKEIIDQKKREVYDRLKEKCEKLGISLLFDYDRDWDDKIYYATNSYWLGEVEKEVIQEIEEKAEEIAIRKREQDKENTCSMCKKVCNYVHKYSFIGEGKYCSECYKDWSKREHGEDITCPDCGKDWSYNTKTKICSSTECLERKNEEEKKTWPSCPYCGNKHHLLVSLKGKKYCGSHKCFMKLEGFQECSECHICDVLENGKCFSCNSEEKRKWEEGENKRREEKAKNERIEEERRKHEWEQREQEAKKQQEKEIKEREKVRRAEEEKEQQEREQREKETQEYQEWNRKVAEYNRLKSLINNAPDLTTLEKIYVKVKNNSLYADNKEIFEGIKGKNAKNARTELDIDYTSHKEKLKNVQESRKNFTTTITNLLNKDKLTNKDLSPQYHNWTEQLKKLTDYEQISHLKDQLITDIQARSQEKKAAQEFIENLAKAQKANATKEEKKQALKDLEKGETTKIHQQKKSQVNSLKVKLAQADPEKYRQEAITNLNHKLQTNKVSVQSLDSEKWKKLNSQVTNNPQEIVALENEITTQIYVKEAEQKLTTLTNLVQQFLQSGQSKQKKDQLKKELLAFITASNIYYAPNKKVAQNLLTQLENYSVPENKPSEKNSDKFSLPTKIFIGTGAGLVILVLGSIVMKTIKRRKKFKRK